MGMSAGAALPSPSRLFEAKLRVCLLYTSDAADERSSVDLGGRRIIKKKQYHESAGQLGLTYTDMNQLSTTEAKMRDR